MCVCVGAWVGGGDNSLSKQRGRDVDDVRVVLLLLLEGGTQIVTIQWSGLGVPVSTLSL